MARATLKLQIKITPQFGFMKFYVIGNEIHLNGIAHVKLKVLDFIPLPKGMYVTLNLERFV